MDPGRSLAGTSAGDEGFGGHRTDSGTAKETAPTASAFHVRDGAITGIRFGCGTPPEWYYQGVDGSRFLYGRAPVP